MCLCECTCVRVNVMFLSRFVLLVCLFTLIFSPVTRSARLASVKTNQIAFIKSIFITFTIVVVVVVILLF